MDKQCTGIATLRLHDGYFDMKVQKKKNIGKDDKREYLKSCKKNDVLFTP